MSNIVAIEPRLTLIKNDIDRLIDLIKCLREEDKLDEILDREWKMVVAGFLELVKKIYFQNNNYPNSFYLPEVNQMERECRLGISMVNGGGKFKVDGERMERLGAVLVELDCMTMMFDRILRNEQLCSTLNDFSKKIIVIFPDIENLNRVQHQKAIELIVKLKNTVLCLEKMLKWMIMYDIQVKKEDIKEQVTKFSGLSDLNELFSVVHENFFDSQADFFLQAAGDFSHNSQSLLNIFGSIQYTEDLESLVNFQIATKSREIIDSTEIIINEILELALSKKKRRQTFKLEIIDFDAITGEEIVISNGTVAAASIIELIWAMTASDPLNLDVGRISNIFMVTYNTFMLSTQLFMMISERYSQAELKKDTLVQIRAINFLRKWITLRYDDIGPQLQNSILRFSNEHGHEHSGLWEKIRESLTESAFHLAQERQAFSLSPFDSINLLDGSFNELSLLDFEPEMIAEQITLLEHSIFSKITVTDFLKKSRTGKGSAIQYSNLRQLSNRFNRYAGWVGYCILASKARETVYKKLIKVANHLRKIGNYHSLVAFVWGLEATALTRIRKTVKLSKTNTATLQELSELVSVSVDLDNLNREINSREPPLIPYTGIYEKAMTILEASGEDVVEDKVNFQKFERMFDTLSPIESYQQNPFNFAPIPQIQNALHRIPNFEEDELIQLAKAFYTKEQSQTTKE